MFFRNGKEDIIDDNNGNMDNNDDNNNTVRNDGKDAMPPKEVRSKAAAKKPTATTKMTLPAPRPLSNFSVNSTNKFAIAYYCKGTQDYADMAIHVNGIVQVSEYRVSVTQDGMSASWQHSIQSVCFTKEILLAIMENAYSPANHHVIAYDDVAQEMFAKK